MGFTGSPPSYLAPSGLGGSSRGSAECVESAIIVIRFVGNFLSPAIRVHADHQCCRVGTVLMSRERLRVGEEVVEKGHREGFLLE